MWPTVRPQDIIKGATGENCIYENSHDMRLGVQSEEQRYHGKEPSLEEGPHQKKVEKHCSGRFSYVKKRLYYDKINE